MKLLIVSYRVTINNFHDMILLNFAHGSAFDVHSVQRSGPFLCSGHHIESILFRASIDIFK